MGSLDDQFGEAGLPALLEALGVQVTWLPGSGGDSRTITAIIDEQQDLDAADFEQRRVREIEVTVGRDPDDTDFGGVADVAEGDQLEKADGTTFAFTGDIRAKLSHSLKFVMHQVDVTSISRQNPRE